MPKIKLNVKPLWLVTGGAGFIGSNIVEELVKRKQKVRVLDNFSTGYREFLKPFAGKIEIIKGDLRKPKDVAKAVKNVTFISHQAALRSVPRSVDNPRLSNKVNVEGTLNLLVEAKKAGVKKLVYASSSSTYGDCKKFPQKEFFAPNPLSPYAVSKLAAEKYCLVWAKNFGLPAVALRYFNVFGPRQSPYSKYSAVIPIFINQIKKNKSLTIHSNGRQARDFTYIANVVSANIKAMLSNVSGEVLNIACNRPHSILEITKLLEKFSGKKLKLKFQPKRTGDIANSRADISKAKKLIKYKVLVGFEAGLMKTWDYFNR